MRFFNYIKETKDFLDNMQFQTLANLEIRWIKFDEEEYLKNLLEMVMKANSPLSVKIYDISNQFGKDLKIEDKMYADLFLNAFSKPYL